MKFPWPAGFQSFRHCTNFSDSKLVMMEYLGDGGIVNVQNVKFLKSPKEHIPTPTSAYQQRSVPDLLFCQDLFPV